MAPQHILNPSLVLFKGTFQHLQKLIPDAEVLPHQTLLQLFQIAVHEDRQCCLLVGQLATDLLQQCQALRLTIVKVGVDLLPAGEVPRSLEVVLDGRPTIIVMAFSSGTKVGCGWRRKQRLPKSVGIAIEWYWLPPILIALVLGQVQIEVQLTAHIFKL